MSLPRRKPRRQLMGTRDETDHRVVCPGHLRWVRANFRCAALTDKCAGPVQAHHVKTRGAGGGDDQVIPLCAVHHAEIHQLGAKSFTEKYHVDLTKMAHDLWMADKYHRGKYEREQRERK